MTNPLGEWEPNWDRIVSSPVWKEEVLPWLKDLLQEDLMKLKDVPDMESLKRMQGRLDAIDDIITMPQAFIEQRKRENERETEDDARRRGIGRYFPARRSS